MNVYYIEKRRKKKKGLPKPYFQGFKKQNKTCELECQRNAMLLYLSVRGTCVCTHVYMEICTQACCGWCPSSHVQQLGESGLKMEGRRSRSLALLLWSPVEPGPRLEDTGKVEPKSNLGPRLQFRTGKSRIFSRAEILQPLEGAHNAVPHPLWLDRSM